MLPYLFVPVVVLLLAYAVSTPSNGILKLGVFLGTAVLMVLMFTGPIEEKRFVDVAENAMYWYFVVFVWLPIYGVIYWAPRLI